jgi:hypothetical protein
MYCCHNTSIPLSYEQTNSAHYEMGLILFESDATASHRALLTRVQLTSPVGSVNHVSRKLETEFNDQIYLRMSKFRH